MLALRYEPDVLEADVAEDSDDADLVTEILIALLSDARADERELPEGVDNRGWWDDALEGEPLGSLLWLLEHAAATDENARRAERYAEAALSYLKRDKRASTIKAAAEVDGARILLSVRVDGSELARGLPVN